MNKGRDRIRLGLVQPRLGPGNWRGNLHLISGSVERLAGEGAQLVLLPELWPTGPPEASSQAPEAEASAVMITELAALAEAHRVVIVGTMAQHVIEDGEARLYNTTHAIGPAFTAFPYRKIHLFEPMGEHRVFHPGTEPGALWLPFGSSEVGLGFLTCFDLRFPELARYLMTLGVDLLVVSSLWPAARRRHFDLLVRARAVENQCFVAAANAWGPMGETIFGGGSCLVGPQGETVAEVADGEGEIVAEVDLARIEATRKVFCTARAPATWWPRSESKFTELSDLVSIAERRRRAGQKLVFTNGCFDLLHPGHVTYLEAARRSGDYLVVGLNSDASVRDLKGPSRPVNSEAARARVLCGLSAVDYVVIFDEPTPLSLIETLLPDVLVKGADWQEEDIVGAAVVKKHGGRVLRIPFVHETSTSHIIKKIRTP